jgi:hypothetical protein
MTGQGCSHGWAWEASGPPTGEPGPANQNVFILSKGLYYRQKYSSISLAVWVAGLKWSCRWRSWMWRSWAGVVCGCETTNSSDNSSGGHSCSQHTNCTFPQLYASSVALCCETTAHFKVAFYGPIRSLGSRVAQHLSARGVTTDPDSIPGCITTGRDRESHKVADNWASVFWVKGIWLSL